MSEDSNPRNPTLIPLMSQDIYHQYAQTEKNLYTKESTVVGCTNLDLIKVESDISDTFSIYNHICK